MDQELKEALSRIAEALDRLAPLTSPPRRDRKRAVDSHKPF
jgi:hypothetical protein